MSRRFVRGFAGFSLLLGLAIAGLALSLPSPVCAQGVCPSGGHDPLRTMRIRLRHGASNLLFTDAATGATIHQLTPTGSVLMKQGETIANASVTTDFIKFTASGGEIRATTGKPFIFYSNNVEQFRFEDGGARIGSGGAIVKMGKYTQVIDFASVAAAQCSAATNISATGVAAGDSCHCQGSANEFASGWFEIGCETITDNVAVRICGHGLIDMASQTYTCTTVEY